MRHYVQGNAAAFKTLMVRYDSKITGFVARRCADRHSIDDLVQEIWMRVVHRASTFREQSSFKTWLYTIARHKCIDVSRRAVHRRAVTLDEPLRRDEEGGVTVVDQAADQGPGPDRLASDRRFLTALEQLMEELPPDQREVFDMRALQQLKFREIAEIVGVPENTIKSRMRYALQTLRGRLEKLGWSLS